MEVGEHIAKPFITSTDGYASITFHLAFKYFAITATAVRVSTGLVFISRWSRAPGSVSRCTCR